MHTNTFSRLCHALVQNFVFGIVSVGEKGPRGCLDGPFSPLLTPFIYDCDNALFQIYSRFKYTKLN